MTRVSMRCHALVTTSKSISLFELVAQSAVLFTSAIHSIPGVIFTRIVAIFCVRLKKSNSRLFGVARIHIRCLIFVTISL